MQIWKVPARRCKEITGHGAEERVTLHTLLKSKIRIDMSTSKNSQSPLENSSSSLAPSAVTEEARRRAQEALQRLKERKEQKLTHIWLKPGESKTLWFDATKQVETPYPNRYSEDENAMRDMIDFAVKTKEGYEKILPMTPTRAELVNEILVEKGGCAWIKVARSGTSNTDTRYNFIPV